MKAPPPPIDTGLKEYVAKLHNRVAQLEGEGQRIVKGQHEQEERLDETHGRVAAEIEQLQEEVRRIDARLMEMVKQTGKLVAAFKNSVRRRQLERIEQRVDMWKGEQYISRDELKRILSKL